MFKNVIIKNNTNAVSDPKTQFIYDVMELEKELTQKWDALNTGIKMNIQPASITDNEIAVWMSNCPFPIKTTESFSEVRCLVEGLISGVMIGRL